MPPPSSRRTFSGRVGRTALIGVVFASLAVAAEPSRADVAELLRDDRIGQVTLSPDGSRLAYTQREGTVLSVVIRPLDGRGKKITVRAEVDGREGFIFRTTNFSVRVPFLQWAHANALVYAMVLPPREMGVPNEELHVVDADGNSDRKLADPISLEAYYTPIVPARMPGAGQSFLDVPSSEQPPPISVPRHLRVLGFDSADRNLILVEAVGSWQVPREVYAIDLRTGQAKRTASEDSEDRFLYDGHGVARIKETKRIRVERLPPPTAGMRPVTILPAPPEVVPQFYFVREPHRFWHRLDDVVAPAALHFSRQDREHYQPRSFPLCFGEDPHVLYFASNVERDTYAVFQLNTETGTKELVASAAGRDLVDPAGEFASGPLVFDRSRRLVGVRILGEPFTTQWRDTELAELQRQLDARFPERSVLILDWTDTKTRVLCYVGGRTEPGRYHIVDQGPRLTTTEVLRRTRNVPVEQLARVDRFTIQGSDGRTIMGTVTLPRWSRVTPPPLLVRCRDVPGFVRPADFDRQAQAFAALGFQVLDVVYRGTAGFGTRHRDAITENLLEVPFADFREALAWIARAHPFDARRVAWIGDGFGGYLALRAIGRFPVRCAVVTDAPSDLDAWVHDLEMIPSARGVNQAQRLPSEPLAWRRAFFTDPIQRMAAPSLVRQAKQIDCPVLLIRHSQRFDLSASQVTDLRDALRSAGKTVEYFEIGSLARDSEVSAKSFQRIGDFLNDVLFSYRVNIGREEVVE